MLIVVVGARGAGKTTLLQRLRDNHGITVLKPSTTRPRREPSEDEYDFVGAWDANLYAWSIPVGSYTYGMRHSELMQAQSATCATVFEPSQLQTFEALRGKLPFETITVGLETIESLAEQQLRVGESADRVMSQKQFDNAREVVSQCDLVLKGEADGVEAALKTCLDILARRGGLLVKEQIIKLLEASVLLERANLKNVQPASYDLSLGDQLWCGGSLVELTDSAPRFSIPPYSYAIVSAREVASFPPFVVGRFDLKVGYFFEGIILSNGPQVDPGYKGALFCMLYNGSGRPKLLARGSHFATIDFTTTQMIAEGYKAKNQFKQRIEAFMSDDVLVARGGAIVELIDDKFAVLARRIRAIKVSFWSIAAAVLAIVLAAPTIGFWVLSAKMTDVDRRIDRLEDVERQLRDLTLGGDARQSIGTELGVNADESVGPEPELGNQSTEPGAGLDEPEAPETDAATPENRGPGSD